MEKENNKNFSPSDYQTTEDIVKSSWREECPRNFLFGTILSVGQIIAGLLWVFLSLFSQENLKSMLTLNNGINLLIGIYFIMLGIGIILRKKWAFYFLMLNFGLSAFCLLLPLGQSSLFGYPFFLFLMFINPLFFILEIVLFILGIIILRWLLLYFHKRRSCFGANYKLNKLTFFKGAGIVFIVFLSIQFIRYLSKDYFLNPPEPVPAGTAQVTPTATINPGENNDWKTYRDKNNSFIIDYPPKDWGIISESDTYILIGNVSTEAPFYSEKLIIEISNQKLDDYISNYKSTASCRLGPPPETESIKKVGKFMLGGTNADKLKACSDFLGTDIDIIFARKNNKSYIIQPISDNAIHYQMLSTFKFIE